MLRNNQHNRTHCETLAFVFCCVFVGVRSTRRHDRQPQLNADRGDVETVSASDGSLYCGGVRVETEVEVEACCDVSSPAHGRTTGGVSSKKKWGNATFSPPPDLTGGLQIQQQTNPNLSWLHLHHTRDDTFSRTALPLIRCCPIQTCCFSFHSNL